MAKIQFPTSDTNPYWDGKEHNVIPMNLARINESDYYYMDGYDIGFGLNMMTLLRPTSLLQTLTRPFTVLLFRLVPIILMRRVYLFSASQRSLLRSLLPFPA